MIGAASVSVDEYIATSYSPDREYLEGELRERHVGEWDHSRLQSLLLKLLLPYEDTLEMLVVPEQRVQVRANRFRVPDLCVVRGIPGEQILTHPPFLAIEILSPEDSMSSMQERIDEYLQFGIENVWIFDPRRKRLFGRTSRACMMQLRASWKRAERRFPLIWECFGRYVKPGPKRPNCET